MFETLKQYDVDPQGVVPFELEGIRRPGQLNYVVLMLASASLEVNSALLSRAMRTAKGGKHGHSVESSFDNPDALVTSLKESLDKDRDMYAGAVVRGWRYVSDDDGNEVPFSVDACREFLRALPDWVFRAIRVFCRDERNFTRIALTADVEEVAGN